MRVIVHAYVYSIIVAIVLAQCPTKEYGRCCDSVLDSRCESDEDCRAFVFANAASSSPPLKCHNSKCLYLRPVSGCSAGTGFNQGEDCSSCEKLYGIEPPSCIPTSQKGASALLEIDLNSCCIIIDENCQTFDDCKKSSYFLGARDGVSYDCYDSSCYYVDKGFVGCIASRFQYCSYNETLSNRCIAVYNGERLAQAPSTVPAPNVSDTPAPGPAPLPLPSPSTVSALNVSDAPAPGPAPSPLPSPSPSPSSSPSPSPSPTTPQPSASAPTSVPTPAPSGDGDGGVGCIAAYQFVVTAHSIKKRIRDLTPGDMVATDEGLREYMGSIHEGSVLPTLVLHTNNSSIEVTGNHLAKTRTGFVHASSITVGDFIATGKVVRITHTTSFVSSPLTRSGTIIVNNVVLSCYASVYSHQVAKIFTYPLRIGVFKNVNLYFKYLIFIHNSLPKHVRRFIASDF